MQCIVNCFSFSLNPLTKEELKAYKSLEFHNQFASGWVKEVKLKLFLNYLFKLPWLLDGSVRNVFPSSFDCSILIRCIAFIASDKIPERNGSISPCSFYGQWPNYCLQVLALSTLQMSSTFCSCCSFPSDLHTRGGVI